MSIEDKIICSECGEILRATLISNDELVTYCKNKECDKYALTNNPIT